MKNAAVGATARVRSYTSTASATTPTLSPISLTAYETSRRPKGRTRSGAKRLPFTARILSVTAAPGEMDKCPVHTRAYAGYCRQVGSLTCRLQEGRDRASGTHRRGATGGARCRDAARTRHPDAIELAADRAGPAPARADHRERRAHRRDPRHEPLRRVRVTRARHGAAGAGARRADRGDLDADRLEHAQAAVGPVLQQRR